MRRAVSPLLPLGLFTLAASVGITGALYALALWVLDGDAGRPCANGTCRSETMIGRVVRDTNFITAWVVFALVAYALFIEVSGVELADAFGTWAVAVPAMAVLIGLIPGCGPPIITTSLYLDGAIPLSAQLGNAISNDGDALFPAIAKAPRVAALATVYTLVPALLVAYAAFVMGF